MQRTWKWSGIHTFFTDAEPEIFAKRCMEAGFAGVEATHAKLEPFSIKELETLGASYRALGVDIPTFHFRFLPEDDVSSFYESIRKNATETVIREMERVVALGVKIGILHPAICRYGVETEGIDGFLRSLGKSLQKILPAAEKFGFTIALENMTPSPDKRFCSIPKHFERVKKEFSHPNLGYCLDTGHALMSMHENAHEFFSVMGDRLIAYHIQDNPGDRDLHLAPGRGRVDWKNIFRTMAEKKFSGTACIEANPFNFGPQYPEESWRIMVEETNALVEKMLQNP
ncbi:MAG: sugar phosphate isomerase/epimerase family protein [Candidatus Ratteibacteria bacterium]|jgi:sugar phosphate isomerase/epimerase